MSKTLFITVETKLRVTVENEDTGVCEIMENMNYNFTSRMGGTKVTKTKIDDWNLDNVVEND